MLNIFIAILLLNFLVPPDSAEIDKPDSANIEIKIYPVKIEDGGELIVALYDNEESWLKTDEALASKTVPAESDTIRVSFENVKPGSYAVSVIHDKNGDGKMNMRLLPFPKPKEGAGVSNNNRRMGKPKFEKALFDLPEQGVSLDIILSY